eukprot:XP_001692827.1 predicted protein [Chlamydomonas reinhardtii]
MVGVCVSHGHAPDWRGVPDAAWDIVLGKLLWSDIASARPPLASALTPMLALHTTRLCPWQRGGVRLDGEGLRLPGALGRVASLRLRSKQPGGGLLARYRELCHVLPAVVVGAPHLTSLKVKGHSRVRDRTPLCGLLYGLRSSLLPQLLELDLSGCLGLSDWGLALLGRAWVSGTAVVRQWYGRGRGGQGVVRSKGVESAARGLTDTGLRGLLRGGGAPHLTSLCINFCGRVTDAGVVAIASGCPTLERLEMDHCVGVVGVVGGGGAGGEALATPAAAMPAAAAPTAAFENVPAKAAAGWLGDGCSSVGGSSSRKAACREWEQLLPVVVLALRELRGLRRVSVEGCSKTLVAALRRGLQPRRSLAAYPTLMKHVWSRA